MPHCPPVEADATPWPREDGSESSESSSGWARADGGRLCRRRMLRADESSAVRRVWSNSALIESVMHACAVTLDARDLARLSCACKEAFKARWPWPCPFLRYPVSKNRSLDEVPQAALSRLATALERPRRFSRRLSLGHSQLLDAWVGRGERSFRSALAISVVAHCSAANRRAVGQTGAVQCLIEHLSTGYDDEDEDDCDDKSSTATARGRRRQRRTSPRTSPVVVVVDSNHDDVPRMRSAAARALCQLARELQCRNTIRDKGGIERLVAVVRNEDNRVEARGRDKAAQAIANMAARDDSAKIAIASANAIPALVELLESHLNDDVTPLENRSCRLSTNAKHRHHLLVAAAATATAANRGHRRAGFLGRGAENAAAALSNLAADRNEGRSASLPLSTDSSMPCPKRLIVEAGALPLLVLFLLYNVSHSTFVQTQARLLERGALRGRENAAGALANLASGGYVGRTAAAAEIVRAGAVPPLVSMVSAAEDGERITERAREKAAAALRFLTHNHSDNRGVVVKCGGLEPLVRLATRINAPSKARQHALQAVHQLASHNDDCLRAVLGMPGGASLLASVQFFQLLNNVAVDRFLQ